MTDQPAVPATPRPAATVVLLRDGEAGCELFMVTRSADSRFMAGGLVFPGGKVDAADLAESSEDGGFRLAAIRELFEEAGVLLACDPGQDALLDPVRAEAIGQRWRGAVHRGEVPFAQVLETESLVPALSSLAFFSHWVAPLTARIRFDTRFYAALAPEAQLAAHDGSELTASRWVSPARVLEEFEAGQVQLAFPTRMNLMLLEGIATAAEAMALLSARRVEQVITEVIRRPEGSLLRIPASAGYPVNELPMEPQG